MPEIGEIRAGKEIGYKVATKCIFQACEDCGKQRWVQIHRGVPIYIRCMSCAAKHRYQLNIHPRKGKYFELHKRCKSHKYVKVWLHPDDFFYRMATKGRYVLEHRLVMAKSLGRCLHSWEIVHHINHLGDDNRIENLQLFSNDRHTQITIMERVIRKLEKRIVLLEAENALLKTSEVSIG